MSGSNTIILKDEQTNKQIKEQTNDHTKISLFSTIVEGILTRASHNIHLSDELH